MQKLHEIEVLLCASPGIMCAEVVQDEPAFNRGKQLRATLDNSLNWVSIWEVKKIISM